ncbi:MAG: hypothetical protein JWM31_989 [Solirubrobacterales bacterium]|nr:hypothetical protein [Solirubrobacterales bacterium]
MTRRGTTAAVLATAAVAGLGLGGGAAGAQAPENSGTPATVILDGSAQKALTRARARWKAAHVRDYRLRVALGCFCPPEATTPRTITVHGGLPVKPPANLRDVASVLRLFRTIQQAIDGEVAGLKVTYGKRGMPTSIAVDVDTHIADEERSYVVDRFQRLG